MEVFIRNMHIWILSWMKISGTSTANIKDFYRQDDQMETLYKIFAGIAILISCLGLYGLVSYMAVQKTREIGVRKVLGASVKQIVLLFSKEFTL